MNNNEIRCPISLEDFSSNEVICRIKECSHIFKIKPLVSWMKINTYCPVCRYDLNTTQEEQPLNENVNSENTEENISDISLTLYYYREPVSERTPPYLRTTVSSESIPTPLSGVNGNLPSPATVNRSSFTLRSEESLNLPSHDTAGGSSTIRSYENINVPTRPLRHNIQTSSTREGSSLSTFRSSSRATPSRNSSNIQSSESRRNNFLTSFQNSLQQTLRDNNIDTELHSLSTVNSNPNTLQSREHQNNVFDYLPENEDDDNLFNFIANNYRYY